MSQVSEVLDSFIRVLAQLAPFLLIGFFAAGMLHVYLPSGLLARILGRPGFGSTVKAALLGVPLPLCSCAVIPVAVELRNSGASRGATASFLVATPETGVDSVAASMAVMHPLIVVFRPIVALVTAVTVGIAVERFSRPRGDRGLSHLARRGFFNGVLELGCEHCKPTSNVPDWAVRRLLLLAVTTARKDSPHMSAATT